MYTDLSNAQQAIGEACRHPNRGPTQLRVRLPDYSSLANGCLELNVAIVTLTLSHGEV